MRQWCLITSLRTRATPVHHLAFSSNPSVLACGLLLLRPQYHFGHTSCESPWPYTEASHDVLSVAGFVAVVQWRSRRKLSGPPGQTDHWQRWWSGGLCSNLCRHLQRTCHWDASCGEVCGTPISCLPDAGTGTSTSPGRTKRASCG